MVTRLFSRAIALAYQNSSNAAPEIALKGDALDADEIVALAKKYNVPVIERGELARALSALEQGEEIPPTLYRAVAIVLAELERESTRL